MRKIFFYICFYSLFSFGQNTKKVLFLGNSYTYVNNLPELLKNAAASTNDLISYDTNTPGGYTLEGHTTNTTSTNKIIQGGWDFVVLQEQSQRPSLPIVQVQTDVFPFATQLNDLIEQHNPCAETVFYMTWGRKNGDASNCPSWPPVCTYIGMDDLIKERYETMATDNDAIVSPVGAVWRKIRTDYPLIELYSSDESHPSLAGSYAAAITFYTTLLRKDPTQITFNSTLSSNEANQIKLAVKTIVFDHLENWFITLYDPIANYNNSINGAEVQFTNLSSNSSSFLWDFGDGTTSTEEHPLHTYNATGNFVVSLTVNNCGKTHQMSTTISIVSLDNELFQNNKSENIYPNPVETELWINNLETIYEIFIHDLLGQKVNIKYPSNDTGTIKINLNQLKSGVYTLTILTTNGLIKKKIIKN